MLGSPTEQTPVFAAVGDFLGSDLASLSMRGPSSASPATAAAATSASFSPVYGDASPDSITPGGQRRVRSSSNACLTLAFAMVRRSAQLILLLLYLDRRGRPNTDPRQTKVGPKRRFLLSAVAPSTSTRHPREARPISWAPRGGLASGGEMSPDAEATIHRASCTLGNQVVRASDGSPVRQERRPTRRHVRRFRRSGNDGRKWPRTTESFPFLLFPTLQMPAATRPI